MASPSAVVEVEAGPAKGLSLTVTPTKTVPVGRDKSLEGCLRDQTISRTHGTFTISADGQLSFTDSSRNGTWYVKYRDKQPTATLKETSQVMQPGDALLLGHTCMRVKSVDVGSFGSRAQSSTSTASSAGRSASPAAARPKFDDEKAKAVYNHPFSQLLRKASAGKALFLAATADHQSGSGGGGAAAGGSGGVGGGAV